jgi:hypothetical protein
MNGGVPIRAAIVAVRAITDRRLLLMTVLTG